MIRRLTLACVGLALCAAGVTQLFAAGPETVAAGKAAAYVRTLQQPDGGFSYGDPPSSAEATIDASFAFASMGVDPKTVLSATGKSPADFLASPAAPPATTSWAATYSASAGGAAKLVLGVATLGLDARSFGGIDPLAAMETKYDAATGGYGVDPFAQAYFMLAEATLHRPVPPASVSFVEAAQKPGGGWEFCSVCGGEDTNTSALLIRALIAGNVPASDPHIVTGLAYLKASQQADGGFPYIAPGGSDPNSTAFSIQAIVAAGQSVETGGPWETSGGKTPLSALLSFQNPAKGALKFFGVDSPFATYQGIPGLMLAAFPERPASEQAQMLTAIAGTSTATATATPTHVPSSTPSATATSRPRTHTPTLQATATPAAVSTNAGAPSTPVRGVLGRSAAPTRITSGLPSTSLPDAGGGSSPPTGAEAWLLLVAGALALTGASVIWRGSR